MPARPDAGELGRTWLFETILEQVSAVSAAPAWCSSSRTCSGPITRTLGVVDHLTRNLAERTVLLVCTCRSDSLGTDGALRTFAAELARGANVRRVELAGLDRPPSR